MSSGCHCFALSPLTRDNDNQPVTTDAARSMSNAVPLSVSPPASWIQNWAASAVATAARPMVAGQSLGLRKKNPATMVARARIAKTPRVAGVPRLNDACKPSRAPETMNKMLVRLRTLYFDGWITAADNGGVNENGFPS